MKKTILLMTIVALLIGLYRWLTSDKEQKQPVEETKAATSEKEENVKGQTEEVKADDTVNENHK